MADFLSKLNPFDSPKGAKNKLKIQLAKNEKQDAGLEPVEVIYNPTEYSLDYNVSWKEQKTVEGGSNQQQFVASDTQKLSFELLIDTTHEAPGDKKRDAGKIADKILAFAKFYGPLHRPPIVEVSWGSHQVFEKGVFESIKRTMVLFDPDGTPTRVKMSCALTKFKPPAEQAKEGKGTSPDRTHTVAVEHGDTLPAIAFRVYGDSSLWRPIAAANNIEDPSRLRPGLILSVPSIVPGGN